MRIVLPRFLRALCRLDWLDPYNPQPAVPTEVTIASMETNVACSADVREVCHSIWTYPCRIRNRDIPSTVRRWIGYFEAAYPLPLWYSPVTRKFVHHFIESAMGGNFDELERAYVASRTHVSLVYPSPRVMAGAAYHVEWLIVPVVAIESEVKSFADQRIKTMNCNVLHRESSLLRAWRGVLIVYK